MALLHDRQDRTSIKQRVEALRPDAARRWGKMSVDQMLHHVNRALDSALGRLEAAPLRMLLPTSVIKFLVINVPRPKGRITKLSAPRPARTTAAFTRGIPTTICANTARDRRAS